MKWTCSLIILFTSFSALSSQYDALSYGSPPDFFKLYSTSESISSSQTLRESYDYYSGSINLELDQISFPGNIDINLPVKVRSVASPPLFNHSYVYLDLPYIVTSTARIDRSKFDGIAAWYDNRGCSQTSGDSFYDPASTMHIPGGKYYSGKHVYFPSSGKDLIYLASQDVKSITDSSLKFISRSGDRVSCTTSNSTYQQGFIVDRKDGLKYHFKQPIYSNPNDEKYFTDNIDSPLEVVDVYMLLTKVEDRFGNYVTYNYQNGNLTNISASDGRVISFSYKQDGYNIIGAGKTWSVDTTKHNGLYDKVISYKKPGGLNYVVTTEALWWDANGFYVGYDKNSPLSSDKNLCDNAISELNSIRRNGYITIETPFGANYRYDFSSTIHGRKNIKHIIDLDGLHSARLRFLTCFISNSLVKKTISYNSKSEVWNYSYSEDRGAFEGTPHRDFKELVITNPDGSREKSRFGINVQLLSEGNILQKEIFSSENTLLARYNYDYNSSIVLGNSGVYNPNSLILERAITSNKFVSNYQGDTYIEENTDISIFGDIAFSKKSNGVSSSVCYKREYLFNSAHWISSMPSKIYSSDCSSNYNIVNEYIYNSASQLSQDKLFNRLFRSYTYHVDGNLAKTTYNGSNRYEQFEDYYRGKARKITLACPTTNGCNTANGSTTNTVVALLEVNADGTTKSVTDFNGNKTSYSYNPVGWLTKIDYADPKWVDKVISYATVATADDGISGSGIAVGSLRQTISQGNFENMVYHDGLLRPVFTRTRDKADTGTISYQRNEYDHENRVTLASFPSSDPANRLGMATEYDALGRVVTQTRTSDNAITHNAYLAGNKIAVTDPMNNITTTTYLAYGEPSFDKPTLIEAPDSDDIAIEYNLFDQVTSIRQGNVTETRLYDAYQQLCKQVRPETGITAFGYNGQRQQIWRAQGANGSTTSCDAGAVPASHKILLGYDNLGQLRTENFPDSTPDKTYSYDANGNLISLLAGPVSWSYLYNSQNVIDKETLSLDGRNFVLDWEYNSLGDLSSLKYPSGAVIDFAPNALGQPTKVGSYATGVSYHPNGQIKQFTYGNGIVRKVALDTTGRIDAITDVKASSVKNSLDPSYDYNDNLARLIDWVDRNNDVDNLVYDGADRLLSADGKWGSGRYNYDGLGNVLSRSLNNSTINYKYNALNRLNNLTGAYAYAYQYDARGNVINNGRYSLAYNLGQQMTAAKGINYVYDGHNRRVKQTKTDGSHYTVYSNGGQLLHREAANGTKTDSVYLGKQLVAEVDNALAGNPPNTGGTPPTVVLKVEATLVGSDCPPKMECPAVVSSPAHLVTWSSTNASSCSGMVNKSFNGATQGIDILSGTNGRKTYTANGIVYQITLTCTGDGGQTTRQETASGVGGGSDM
ncbi:RHS repeat domain-containing protein [Shewanella baltica]|uniref:RHS repeat domain-containing protein n=1 Tax=Shewanella baltica TaxID=62322 RepID=UPI000E085C62|nr:RHS repeat protein [Shewanella baltica]SUI78362.1 RHS Repeat [Shewanella baltica]